MDKYAANEQITRNLFDAIERVRQDVALVEFWAGAVSGFSQPVPDYDPGSMTGWFPREQVTRLSGDRRQTSEAMTRNPNRSDH